MSKVFCGVGSLGHVWKAVREEADRLPKHPDVEIGFNICSDDGITFYITDFSIGDKDSIEIPNNDFSIASFHTHPHGHGNAVYGFSVDDIKDSHITSDRFAFFSDGIELYGVDLNKYMSRLDKCVKHSDYKRITELINERLNVFYMTEV